MKRRRCFMQYLNKKNSCCSKHNNNNIIKKMKTLLDLIVFRTPRRGVGWLRANDRQSRENTFYFIRFLLNGHGSKAPAVPWPRSPPCAVTFAFYRTPKVFPHKHEYHNTPTLIKKSPVLTFKRPKNNNNNNR